MDSASLVKQLHKQKDNIVDQHSKKGGKSCDNKVGIKMVTR